MYSVDLDALAATIKAGLMIEPPSEHVYSWVVEEAVWKKLATGFDHTTLKDPERNIALKKHLAGVWTSADPVSKFALAKWVISDWGKIRGNSDETIRRHVELADAPNPDLLSIKDPERFAIFDARVATSLNAIQLIQGNGTFAFPIPPGRNTEIDKPNTKQGFSDVYTMEMLAGRGFATAPRRATYAMYLKLLENLARITREPVVLLEMKLFGRAIEYSQGSGSLSEDSLLRLPYSLRHTYATMRLAEGVSVFQLAANMGTSVEMLEEFYGKKRMREPRLQKLASRL